MAAYLDSDECVFAAGVYLTGQRKDECLTLGQYRVGRIRVA